MRIRWRLRRPMLTNPFQPWPWRRWRFYLKLALGLWFTYPLIHYLRTHPGQHARGALIGVTTVAVLRYSPHTRRAVGAIARQMLTS